MRTFLAIVFSLWFAVAHAANPSTKSFRGTGGIGIISNDVSGLIIVDGSGIFTTSGTNATVAISTNGALVMVAATNVNFVTGSNVFLAATNIGSSAHIGISAFTPVPFIEGAVSNFLLTYILPVLTVDTSTISNLSSAPPLSSVQYNSNGITRGSAGLIYTNGQLQVADVVIAGQGVEVTAGSFVLNGGTTALVAWNGLGRIRWDADGVMKLENDAANGFNRVNFRDNTAASPALGITNGDFIILGGNGNFKTGGSTNRLIVPAVHIANDSAMGTSLLRLENPLSGLKWDLAIGSHAETSLLGLGFNDGNYAMVWELNGNVGVGTTNPGVQLDVQGRFRGSSNVYFPNISSNATPVAFLAVDSGGEVFETAIPTVAASPETNAVLTNIIGTVARNVTNVVSLSTTNATSKPLTNAYANGVLTLFGVEAGANVTITPNGSNLVIAASASGGGGAGSLAVNDNQFLTNSLLNIKDGALITNVVTYGLLATNQTPTGATAAFYASNNPTPTLWLASNGFAGVRTGAPLAPFHVASPNLVVGVLFAGVTKGVRFGFNTTGSTVEGVDNTGSASFQPLTISGSTLDLNTAGSGRLTVNGSGQVGIGTNGPAARLVAIADNSVSNVVQFGTTNRPHLLTMDTNGLVWMPGGIVLTNANVAAGKVWTAVGGLGGGTWSNAPAGSSGFVAGNSNQIPFINGPQTGYTYAGYLSSTNPGFGFSPSGTAPHGYGGLMVFANSPMGLVTIGHPNAGSDFSTFATAMVISNRYQGAGDFKNDMVKIDAVLVNGTTLQADSTMTRWRVWQASGASSDPSTGSNDVAELTIEGRMRLYGGTHYRSNTVALPTAAELGAGGSWVGVSNNAAGSKLVTMWSVDGVTASIKVLAP